LGAVVLPADTLEVRLGRCSDWLERVIGSMKDESAFDEVLALGRAIRQADRPAEDQAP
jgi:hypothetical protein